MENNYSYLNISKSQIDFIINKDSIISKFQDGIKKDDCFINQSSKGKLPKNKIFRLNSLIFNNEKNCQEIYNVYDCIYNEKDNLLYLIITEKDNYNNFTKDKLINILEFSISLGIDKICLLVSKINSQYLNIVQDMLVVGFKPEENLKIIKIDGKEYKILKMSIKDICQEIKEITII